MIFIPSPFLIALIWGLAEDVNHWAVYQELTLDLIPNLFRSSQFVTNIISNKILNSFWWSRDINKLENTFITLEKLNKGWSSSFCSLTSPGPEGSDLEKVTSTFKDGKKMEANTFHFSLFIGCNEHSSCRCYSNSYGNGNCHSSGNMMSLINYHW